MPRLVPGIPIPNAYCQLQRDGRDKPGHDGEERDHYSAAAAAAAFAAACSRTNFSMAS
jgi:hypothetical protein